MSPPPLKPVNSFTANVDANDGRRSLNDSMFNDRMGGNPVAGHVPPPPIPPRPVNNVVNGYGSQPSNIGYSSYGSQFGYGGGMGGGYGASPYSPFGGTSLPYNSYGSNSYGYGGSGGFGGSSYGNPIDMQISRFAQERSRQAFQSVETVLHGFRSMTMMLDSALQAIYASLDAVIGLGDQFSTLRTHFQHLLSTLSIFRLVRWLYAKMLVLLRLRDHSVSDAVWQETIQGSSADLSASCGASAVGSKANWPLVIFWGIALGGPYLIYRLVKQMAESEKEKTKWAVGESEHFVAVALYDFQKSSQNELGFQAGQQLIIAPKEAQPAVRDWLLASIRQENQTIAQTPMIGLVPANYIKIMNKKTFTTATSVGLNETIQSEQT